MYSKTDASLTFTYNDGPFLDFLRQLCPALLYPARGERAELDGEQAEVDAGGRGVQLVDARVRRQEDCKRQGIKPKPNALICAWKKGAADLWYIQCR